MDVIIAAWSVLFCVVVSLFDLTSAESLTGGLYCYVCDTDKDFSCFDPGKPTNVEICQYGCVMKITAASDQSSVSVIRSCGTWRAQYDVGCVSSAGENNSILTECQCKTDYCNSDEQMPGTDINLTQCYDCDFYGTTYNLLDDTECHKPGQNTATVLCPYGHCRKVLYESGDYTGIGRMCVNSVSEENLVCTSEAANGISYEICHCKGHLCNGAVRVVTIETLLMMTTTLLSTVVL